MREYETLVFFLVVFGTVLDHWKCTKWNCYKLYQEDPCCNPPEYRSPLDFWRDLPSWWVLRAWNRSWYWCGWPMGGRTPQPVLDLVAVDVHRQHLVRSHPDPPSLYAYRHPLDCVPIQIHPRHRRHSLSANIWSPNSRYNPLNPDLEEGSAGGAEGFALGGGRGRRWGERGLEGWGRRVATVTRCGLICGLSLLELSENKMTEVQQNSPTWLQHIHIVCEAHTHYTLNYVWNLHIMWVCWRLLFLHLLLLFWKWGRAGRALSHNTRRKFWTVRVLYKGSTLMP